MAFLSAKVPDHTKQLGAQKYTKMINCTNNLDLTAFQDTPKGVARGGPGVPVTPPL